VTRVPWLVLAIASPAQADAPEANVAVDARPSAPEGLSATVWHDALAARDCALARDEALRDDVLVVVDFSQPSTEERLWVVRPASGEVLLRTHVAHGRGTGGLMAASFSNVPESHQSSLGVFRGGETYVGKHGRSLRLDGLEPGINDRARDRAIVVHAADYATAAFADRVGRLGRSHGCPAVPPEDRDPLIRHLQQGGLMVAWADDPSWRAHSELLTCPPSSDP